MNNLRSTRRHKLLRQQFRAECEAEDVPCWICGLPIEYALRAGADAFQLDHYKPVSKFPQHVDDPANFKASHARCNAARGDGAPMAGLGRLSREW